MATPDSPWHRPIPRPSVGDGPSIGGNRPVVPEGSGIRPPTPRAQTSTATVVGNLSPRPPGGGKPPRNSGNGFQAKRVLQLLSMSAGVFLVVGFVVLMMNRSDSTTGSTVEKKPSITATSSENSVVTVPITKGSEWESLARSVVFIEAQGSQCGWTGSGSIVSDGSYVLTNQHVAGDGECELIVWLTDSTTSSPTKYLKGELVIADEARDLAVIRMIDADGSPYIDETRTPLQFAKSLPKLGDKLTILGYPGLGGSSITLTSGDFSGIDTSEQFDFLKTTANMNPGVSGGSALNSAGELVGIPTAGRGAEVACNQQSDCVANGSTIGLLRPVSLASELVARIPN